MNKMGKDITKSLLGKGASLIGFADLDEIPANARSSLRYAVSIAVALDAPTIARIRSGPTQEYYSEYKRANALLSELGEYTARVLRENGYEAISKAPTYVGIDPKTQSTTLPHKTVATRAGLGWIGKCALLVSKQYGSAIRLITVLTNANLDTGVPMNESACGDCMVCVKACPASAPSGKNWKVGLHRASFFNAFSCCRGAREQAIAKIGVQDTICGICISVCPWTKKYIRRSSSRVQTPD